MYYVPDGTEVCGFYECCNCDSRFLDVNIRPTMICPYCGTAPDMEIGPDDEIPVSLETAKLISVIEGEENVEKTDGLLALAFTGGDYEWI